MQNTVPIMKFGGGSNMVWSYSFFSCWQSSHHLVGFRERVTDQVNHRTLVQLGIYEKEQNIRGHESSSEQTWLLSNEYILVNIFNTYSWDVPLLFI